MPHAEAARVAAKTTAPANHPSRSERGEIKRLADHRDRVARMIADGQHWLLPIFERLEHELEALSIRQSALDRALLIARNNAARIRAA
jgi:hypothetical protein